MSLFPSFPSNERKVLVPLPPLLWGIKAKVWFKISVCAAGPISICALIVGPPAPLMPVQIPGVGPPSLLQVKCRDRGAPAPTPYPQKCSFLGLAFEKLSFILSYSWSCPHSFHRLAGICLFQGPAATPWCSSTTTSLKAWEPLCSFCTG